MLMAQKYTHRSMKQNREPRNKHLYGQLICDEKRQIQKNIAKANVQEIIICFLLRILWFQGVPD